ILVALQAVILPMSACASDDNTITRGEADQGSQALTGCGWGGGDFVRTGRFNADSRLDVVSPKGGTINTYFRGQFDYQTAQGDKTWGMSGYTWAADFNGDGLTDLASANGGTVNMKLSRGISNGIITFDSLSWNPQPGCVQPVGWGLAGYTFVGDFN